jgi:hypothetical protein
VGRFELLPVEAGIGFARLPEPSEGDVFFDLEGDPFVGEHGIEYLFGYLFKEAHGGLAYVGDWALSRADEKRAFETFVDFAMARWAQFPGMHIYHYAPYEPAALKRLMGRYATRQEEIDRMLRAGLFVDLYHVVRHALRASVESYSIKRLEEFYGFDRASALVDANAALTNLQASLELSDVPSISDEIRATVRAYNPQDDGPAIMRGLVAFAELSSLGDASFLDRSQVNLKQGLVFFALLLILLSQPDDLSKDLNVEAIALGFLKNLPLAFVQLFDFFFDVLDAFDDGAQLIARNLNRSTHDGLLPFTRTQPN